ncbi:hypothetical protein BJ322DRAFT_1154254 [Thelephora terrestris]|uniref:Uncharacterized protein n=1 Tax=Thelephora terrestris TaxID=56493 RepID=A0A9P6HRM2_9AGAM|nr:hypothetical protein BJ322DRAFT_1154254 [Thelephora terrestris]
MSSFAANNIVLNAAATPFTPSFETDAPYDVEQHLYDSPANIAHDNQVAINFLTAHNAPAEFWEQAGYEDPRLSGPVVRAQHPGAVLLLDAMEREREDRIAKLEKRVDLMHLSSDISDTNVTGLIAPTPLASPQSSLRHRQDQGVPLPPSPPWSPAPVRQMVERSQKKKNRKSPMTRSGQRCRPSDKSRQRLAPLNRGPDLLTAISALSDSEGFVASSPYSPWVMGRAYHHTALYNPWVMDRPYADPIPAIDKIMAHFGRLAEANVAVPDFIKAMMILSRMPPAYDYLAQILCQADDIGKVQIDELRKMVKLAWEQKSSSRRSGQQAQKLSNVQRAPGNPNFQQQQQHDGSQPQGQGRGRNR